MAPSAARLETLSVRDFRNIAHAELQLPPEGIAVVGDNGQGKTNLAEAIAYLRLLRSIRGARDRDLIRFDAPAFHLSATLGGLAAHRVSAGVDRASRKKVTLDGGEPEKLTDALDALPSVSFSPRDVDLIVGAPAERRRYLDITLALTSAPYLHALRKYRAALVRRNAALRDLMKRSKGRGAELGAAAAWEPALAEHGAILIRARRAWVATHGSAFTAKCAAIGESARAEISYNGITAEDAEDAEVRDVLAAELDRQRDQDFRRGLTQSGPHRDDLMLSLDGHDLRLVGSAGQQRTAAIVLRMLEAATHREATGIVPLLLLDDPFAELDRRRTQRILALLEESGVCQCVLGVPREDEIPPQFTRLERWRVREGSFSR